VILIQGLQSDSFFQSTLGLFRCSAAGLLLGQNTLDKLRETIARMARLGAEIVTGGREQDGPGFRLENTLLRVSGDAFLDHPLELQVEAFGAVSLLVFAKDEGQMLRIVDCLEGNLAGAIYSDSLDKDDDLYARIEPLLRRKVGVCSTIRCRRVSPSRRP